jgi:uncharacterized phage-like protein YoqJ
MNDEIKTIFFTGYSSFELGVFKDNDPKVVVIKKAIKEKLIQLLDTGLEWVLIGGALGTELWVADVVAEIQVEGEYPEIKLGVITPFANFGEKWNEANLAKLSTAKMNADYVNSTSSKPYENPAQLRAHTQFLLGHTDGAVLLYDEEFEGKSKWFLRDALRFAENHNYYIDEITMDDLQNATNEY